jgi:hypothetical protein
MIKLNIEMAELTLIDLDQVAGGGAIGDAATQKTNGIFKAASDIGSAAVYVHVDEILTQIMQH